MTEFRVGTDIGGTFTDTVAIDKDGKIMLGKSSTTYKDLAIGVFNCLEEVAEKYKLGLTEFLGQIRFFVHGTTIATNTLLEHRGAKTGLITTKGFRDIIEMRRAHKPDLWNLRVKQPDPIVPRYLRIGVEERIDKNGNIITPLNEEEVREAVRLFKKEKVESIAVCTLFSFLNDAHEKRIKEIIKEEYPEVYVSISSEVLPQIREFERTSATVINAYLQPIVDRYLLSLEEKLRSKGLKTMPFVMQSNGGIMAFSVARLKPIHMIESGPAAGVIGATYLGHIVGINDLISFDMGGTTAKAGLVRNGMPDVTTEYEVGGEVHTMTLTKKGGYPVNVPVIDLSEVSGGGGSIAWIDQGGALKVGPRSAGSEPGPVAYGLGGTEPTVTDADLILGFLNNDFFLGGKMKLQYDAAYKAIKEIIADKLGVDPLRAAFGIFEVVNNNMVDVLRVVTIQKGYDPRELTMIAFGGGGGVHAAFLAQDLGAPQVIVPKTASAFSALGMVETYLKHDFVKTYRGILQELDTDDVNRIFAQLEKDGFELLKKEGIRDEEMKALYSFDLRYIGQHHEVTVEIPAHKLGKGDIAHIEEIFHQRHEALYAYREEGSPIEIINIRVSVIGEIPKTKLPEEKIVGSDPSKAYVGSRDVLYEGFADKVPTKVYRGDLLSPGNEIEGPAIIEETTTTIVIPPKCSARVDQFRNVIIKIGV
ncbi:MAG: hydantoinase/oxoprolinase family protein [Candidatus Odinarchaeota archaeon]|nr:hydantoinase/oxoprolinase family protein [Candidatus Odinarchaeota archaeon]